MERRKRLDELILMAQTGDEEAFANMILYIKVTILNGLNGLILLDYVWLYEFQK